jgi:hypothetical protein
MQGIPNQLIPTINNGHHFIYRKHYTGQKNRWGQRYIIRNVFFEPAASGYNQAETLNRIKTAFRWGKPAVIGSHRLNYMGSINPENRNLNLKYLKELLCQIVRIWPDVEFMSTDQVGGLMSIKQ